MTQGSGDTDIRLLDDADRAWLAELIAGTWGLPVVSTSGAHDPTTLPGFVAEAAARRIGVATYRLGEGGCEVVTLNSLEEGKGVGTALLAAVRGVADREGRRLWLITTEENLRAIAFYEKRGMAITAIHRNFADQVRRYKPELADGDGSVPFRHAIEFSYPDPRAAAPSSRG
ncbi:MAG TPA: GNAT family N-acetyltransferase [Acidimicrobiales bacterium]|nr:GNAT family N-acetyltransferase [Acidimicrobiales bacterium]